MDEAWTAVYADLSGAMMRDDEEWLSRMRLQAGASVRHGQLASITPAPKTSGPKRTEIGIRVLGPAGFASQRRVHMKALVWHGKEDIRCDTVSDPEIQEPRDAIVKVTSCAICGSDLHLFHNFISPQSYLLAKPRLPRSTAY